MSWFEPFAASAGLGDVLACRYVASTAGRHDLLPDGCVDLLWIEGAGVVLCGPDTHAWSFELPAGTAVAGVRFRPGAAPGVLRLDAVEMRDERIGLGDLIGSRQARTLGEQIAAAEDPHARTGLLEDLVLRRRTDAPTDDMIQLAALVGSDPAFGVERLAAETGVSSRQLRRRFDRHVGYGPAFFARIARLQRFARSAARQPRHGLAELAASAGYVDQPHLAKDCRDIAGLTPRELVGILPRSSLAVRLGEPSRQPAGVHGWPAGAIRPRRRDVRSVQDPIPPRTTLGT